jgi:Spy/CpxP family protein refolding chaperone
LVGHGAEGEHDDLGQGQRGGSKPEPNAEELARLQASLDAVKASLRQQREASKAEISAVLTPEQRERLDAMKAKHERDGKDKAHAKRARGGREAVLAG